MVLIVLRHADVDSSRLQRPRVDLARLLLALPGRRGVLAAHGSRDRMLVEVPLALQHGQLLLSLRLKQGGQAGAPDLLIDVMVLLLLRRSQQRFLFALLRALVDTGLFRDILHLLEHVLDALSL